MEFITKYIENKSKFQKKYEEKELLIKWEFTGLLNDIKEEYKLLFVTKFEKAAEYLNSEEKFDKLTSRVIFPILRKYLFKSENIDTITVVKDIKEIIKKNGFTYSADFNEEAFIRAFVEMYKY